MSDRQRGSLVASRARARGSARTAPSRSAKLLMEPATGRRLASLKEHDLAHVKQAVRKAREAQRAWAETPLRERQARAREMGRAIMARADQIAEIVSRCTGKTRVDALSGDVFSAVGMPAYYARIAPSVLRPRKLRRSSILFFNKISRLTRVPYGVIGIITPWNYPFSLPMHEVVQALLAGNGVVLKVSTQVQPVGEEIAELVKAAGFPEGLFSLVHMRGAAAADAMLASGIDKLFFTGSIASGKELMAKAAARLVPVVLELGGNDPMIVLDDANLDRAAAGALWAGMTNAGQSCAGVERVYVQEGAWDGFRKRLADQVSRLRVGPDKDFDVEVGSLTSDEQKRKVEGVLRDALKKGARIVAQSGPSSGLFQPLIVLENADGSMTAMCEEIFGPIIALQKVRDESEAVARANDSVYGLTASVWSGNRRRARRVASRIRAGAVTLNDHLISFGMAETPWGGFGQSGIGRTHGALGFEEMTQPRVIVDDRLHRAPRNMWWYPYDRSVYEGLKGAMIALHGRGLFRRLAGLGRLIRTFMRSFRTG
ncbi:MAG: aldehyde dehydrogenase family protein [Spirochaetia bacterium]